MSDLSEGAVRAVKKRLLPICLCVEDSSLVRKTSVSINLPLLFEKLTEIGEREKTIDIELRVQAFSENEITPITKFCSIGDIKIDDIKSRIEDLRFSGGGNVKLFECLLDSFWNIERIKHLNDNSYKPIVFLIGAGGSDKQPEKIPEIVLTKLYGNDIILLIKPLGKKAGDLSIYEYLCGLNGSSSMFDSDRSLENCVNDFIQSVEIMSSSTAANYRQIKEADQTIWKELK